MGLLARELPVSAAALSEAETFDRWVLAEQRRIFLLCYRMLGDRDEADTATQDTFLKAYKALRRTGAADVDDPAKWLTRIAVNTCLDRLRSRRWKFWKNRPTEEDEELILRLTPARNPDAEAQYFAREIEQRLQAALQQLSPKQRAVFMLRHFEDRKLEEIAELMGMELGTVKAHMARALARLRELLYDLYWPSQAKAREGGNHAS